MEAQRVTRVLRQFLETDLLLGVGSTPLRRRPAAPAAPAAAIPAASRPPEAARGTTAATPAASAPPAPAPAVPDLGDAPAADRLALLAERLAADPEVAGRLAGSPPALGVGALPARVVFVGEPPRDDASGREAEEAEKLLDGMVEAMKLSPADVFRCPCLPFPPASGGHPSAAELAAGAPALRAQLLLAKPEVVVALGGAAAKALLGGTTGITRLRGAWAACAWTDPPVPVMPTLAPAFVLRSYTRDNRMMVWGDLRLVMEKLEESEEERK